MTDFDCLNEHLGFHSSLLLGTVVFAWVIFGQILAMVLWQVGFHCFSFFRRK